ncbi:hypothetical protein [Allobranchiibius huperziae]|uniref:Uncharacterized protein n=1 Tax=Allobranchiibius huperziae TaxID=1874116 RepID=A0A853DLW1_9MICO|nr:hypothetical protein [Allobranchiibius huperziae]NYJ75620.1 hypothetical protein [Allobranchiibius huperziae]
MTFTYADRPVARHLDADDAEALTEELNFYFMNLTTRDVAAKVTVLAGPQVWCEPNGRMHALLIVKSDVEDAPYDDISLQIHGNELDE